MGTILLLLLASCSDNGGIGGARTPTNTRAPVATSTPVPSIGPSPTPTSSPVPTVSPAASFVGGPLAMRRLTGVQYRATIADVLGADIAIGGRLEPDNRRDGLLAVGSSFVSVTGAGFEQYEALARSIAEQALAPAHRAALVPCAPQDATAPDDACAAEFVRSVGGRLLRRPLRDTEVDGRVAVAGAAAATLSDFYAGLETALSTLLLSPEFLFRVESAEPDPAAPERLRLTSTAMATRLSYLLWNSTPDDELLAAAERDELVDDDGLAAQVDRLLASPRLEESSRAFFADLFGFDEIENGLVRKDPTLFPAFSQALIRDAREQTLRVVADHLIRADGDYRDLFTTRQSFMTRTLGLVYEVPVRTAVGWERFTFPADSERGGLLTQVSILALRAHAGRSSPTLRGKFVREVLLCTDVPPPPGDIDFSMFAEEGGENRRTARERLAVHAAEPVCAGCHSLMDPIGLGLEQMDGIGAYRDTENGATIDPSGELNGVPFADAVGLGAALAADPQLGPCFVDNLYRYAVGRAPEADERAWLAGVQADSEASGYRWRELLRRIALSDVFRTTSGVRMAELPTVTPTAVATTPPTPSTPSPTPTAAPTDAVPRTPTPRPTATATVASFARIQAEIFTPRCATQYCHSAQTRSGGLVLEAGAAYAALVGVEPTLAGARTAGLLRVDPSKPENSFLLLKLTGPTSVSLGSRMPLIGAPLGEAEIELVRAWIAAGANP